MRLPVLVLTALIGSCVAPPPAPNSGPRQVTELVGRVAGPPQRCIPIQIDGNLRPSSSDPGTLLYGNGSLIWANHMSPGCHFDFNDTLVLNPTGSSYCQNDIVRSFQGSSRFPGPSCFMGPFIPYRS
jgi:hypothetical protein